MKTLIGSLTLALALLIAGCGDGGDQALPIAAPTPAIPAPNGGEWTRTIVETPEGGFRMGNPDAPVKLVEYASATCPHCARFSKDATAPLTHLVRSGHLSWEFRHYLLFPMDPPLSLLARCGGPRDFFTLTERLYAGQADWYDKVYALPSDQLEQIRSLPASRQPAAMIRSVDYDEWLRQRGVPKAQVESCLDDEQGLRKLEALTILGRREGVRGTPSFFINGRLVEGAGNWRALRPALQAAFAR